MIEIEGSEIPAPPPPAAPTPSPPQAAGRPMPTPRRLRLDYTAIPRHWLGGDPVSTHVANGVNLLFPAGERFFVRSVNRYLDQLKDPKLVARVRGFFGQEGRHARAHEDTFETMRAQG